MSRARVWFPVSLVILSACGAAALCRPECVERSERDVEFFFERHIWERSFDALSAACGAGLLSGPIDKAYTPTGRWTLFAIGLAGALLYVTAAARVTARLLALDATAARLANVAVGSVPPAYPEAAGSHSPTAGAVIQAVPASAVPRPPSMFALWLLFLGVQALLTLGVWAAGRAVCPDVGVGETAWLTGMAFFSVGSVPQPVDFGTAQMLAAVGWIGALGWPVWMLLIPGLRRKFVSASAAIKLAGGYTLFLIIAAGAIYVLECPRGGIDIAFRGAESTEPDPALPKQTPQVRAVRSLVAVMCASSAGIPTEPLGDRGLRDSSKAVLALVLLVGGLGGAAAGGLKWPLLIAAFQGSAAPYLRRAATTSVLWMLGLTVLTAAGLLLIESQVATRYQSQPTVADALLDATSAVAGGNLSSGLARTVTDKNLVSGIFLGVNWYRIGFLWLAAAMLAGRILPIVILGGAGRTQEHAGRGSAVCV